MRLAMHGKPLPTQKGGTNMTFYEAIKHIPHDHHESDLYVLVTRESAVLCREYGKTGKVFRSELDGQAYFDIPFAYEPFWTAKAEGR